MPAASMRIRLLYQVGMPSSAASVITRVLLRVLLRDDDSSRLNIKAALPFPLFFSNSIAWKATKE